MYWFLSQNWSGLVIATVVGLVAAILISIGAGLKILGACLMLLAVLAFGGSLFHLLAARRYRQRYPPPGNLVDVGGYRLHLLAEGTGGTPVVWIPGSHDQGLAFHHLHTVLARETRSILYDRAGSGWSDIGPFPRRIAREVDELNTLLERAGETGPFIIVAHSLGGFVAQNYAERFPTQVAGLVLLDSSSVDASVYTRRMKENRIPGFGLRNWASAAFGLAWMIVGRLHRKQPSWLEIYDEDIRYAVLAANCHPKLSVGFMSSLTAVFDHPFDFAQGDGVLRNVPLFAVIPPISEIVQHEEIKKTLPRFSDWQIKNFVRFLNTAQRRIAKMSTSGELHYSPDNTTHSFPFEAPEATLDEVRAMLKLIDNGTATDDANGPRRAEGD